MQVITTAKLIKKLIYLSQLIVMAWIVIMNGLEMKVMPLDDVNRILSLMENVQSTRLEIILSGAILSFIRN